MGEDNEEWGTPKMYLGDGTELVLAQKSISALAKEVDDFNSETEIANHYIGIPEEGMRCSFSVKLSKAAYRRMMYSFAIEMAHHEAERLNDWIKERILGSKFPRKKKKWCKKSLANIISETTGIPKNIILRHLKVKRK